ncbi:GNAT family N-acetyltransferase [Paenibacillaceae bacterium WGS1546]|uniref:GNAT family N-acetyltransferase n=1 Tax=Cohnella sp. WGS1546 TaxID=3366810 RepID=UPI00372D0863
MDERERNRIETIEQAEIEYATDRMQAIRDRAGNPEGVEIARIGGAVCLYSRTMPWPQFNAVRGLRSEAADSLGQIVEYYRSRGRKPQFEFVPSLADRSVMKRLDELGFYQSGFHASLFRSVEPLPADAQPDKPIVRELREDEFETYAKIHCRAFGLPEDGIGPVAENNRVLYGRPGWTFYLALIDDRPAGVGVVFKRDEAASLTFAATLPDYRGRGVHAALLRKRIEDALGGGCRWLYGQCAFASGSHRNMARAGMGVGYVKALWTERD